MFREQTRLRDQIVFMEAADAHHLKMDAARYLAAARIARTIVERELGVLQMSEFAIHPLPALQTTAENIYFESYGCLADLDGSGHAGIAQQLGEQLIERLMKKARSR